jgi:hypothetical protein
LSQGLNVKAPLPDRSHNPLDGLMEWHDNWMSTDDYTSMCDSDANELEDLFQRNASSFTDGFVDSGP